MDGLAARRPLPIDQRKAATMSAPPIDRIIADLARNQHGVFNRSQALARGCTPRQIDHRVSTRRWIRLASGVYALPGNEPTWHRQVMAAVLGEPVAFASFGSAGLLHGVDGSRQARPEITVPALANHRSSLAIVHRSDRIATTTVDRIPATTVEQTVVDLAGRLGIIRLGDIIDGLIRSKKTSLAKVSARHQALRLPATAGSGRLEKVLVARSVDAWVPPASVLERAMYELLDHPAVPPFVRKPAFPWRPQDPQRLDTYIPSWLLFVEADGRAWHTRERDFARDRRRDHEVLAHGHRILRLGWEEIIEDPAYALDTILAVGTPTTSRPIAAGE